MRLLRACTDSALGQRSKARAVASLDDLQPPSPGPRHPLCRRLALVSSISEDHRHAGERPARNPQERHGSVAVLGCWPRHLDPPNRFRRSRDMGPISAGHRRRCPCGQPEVQDGIGRCGDELARTALDEAAHSLLNRSRRWSTLRACGMTRGADRGRPQARSHPASDVGRGRRAPLRQG